MMPDESKVFHERDQERMPDEEAEAQRWISALTLTGLLLTLLVVAASFSSVAPRDVDRACFERKLNGEHALMEAFFQNPPEQSAVVQAMRACSHGLPARLGQS
jgi:hypothetical protein